MKLKASLCVLSILPCFFQLTFAATAFPPLAQEYLKHAIVLEDGSLDIRNRGYSDFNTYFKTNWRDALENIQIVAPTDKQKRVLVSECESLNDSDYLLAIQIIGDLFVKEKISINVVSPIFTPSMARESFLDDNSKNPIVRSFLEKVRSRTVKDRQLQSCISDILSGRASTNQDASDPDASALPLPSAGYNPSEVLKPLSSKSLYTTAPKNFSKTSHWLAFTLVGTTFLVSSVFVFFRKRRDKMRQP